MAMHEITATWNTFKTRPFPNGARDQMIGDRDLASLDSFAAGCIDTFVERKGRLDAARATVLEHTLIEIDRALPHLDTESQSYFQMLSQLGHDILAIVQS